jgi:hypothetical protein
MRTERARNLHYVKEIPRVATQQMLARIEAVDKINDYWRECERSGQALPGKRDVVGFGMPNHKKMEKTL